MTGDSRLAPVGYRWVRDISRAPLTAVIEAAREAGHERVFVKRLLSRGQIDPRAREAFAREAAITEALARAGARVAPFVSAGTDAHGPYLVTGALAAEALAPLAANELDVAVARAAFAALASVHAAEDARGPLGVVHHDVHLDNVVLAGGKAWVVDFGLATARVDVCAGSAPDPGIFRGTVRYAAPEAARGEATSPSSDRFSLAASLLHRATAIDPRGEASAPAELLYRAGSEPLDRWLAALPRSPLVDALAPLLAFDAHDRPTAPAW